MYSQNDWRSYTELYHKDAKWEWPNGNNSREYNQWYYKTHPEKWERKPGESGEEHLRRIAFDAIKEGGKWVYNKGKEVVENIKEDLTSNKRDDGLVQLEDGTLIDPTWATNPRNDLYDKIDEGARRAYDAYDRNKKKEPEIEVPETITTSTAVPKKNSGFDKNAFEEGLAAFNSFAFGRAGDRFNKHVLNR